MKIEFIDGHYITGEGDVIWSRANDCFVRGYFEITVTSKYDEPRLRVVNREVKTKIVVVKQRNKLRMLRTLCHELAHWFIFTFVTKARNNKYDKWLDR